MNERIKELRRIAQNEVCFQAYEENERKWTAEEVDAKFAELIVRECLAECWYDCTPKQISDNIKTKFGVNDGN